MSERGGDDVDGAKGAMESSSGFNVVPNLYNKIIAFMMPIKYH
jgi:hypothetical protein